MKQAVTFNHCLTGGKSDRMMFISSCQQQLHTHSGRSEAWEMNCTGILTLNWETEVKSKDTKVQNAAAAI